ncbi:DUF3891 family protein [Hymenobacter taeanensis]|uniref:DUF3891 family protein n=1 Tax=Hymenobacter taeanensis TaxID=2735321 RepID=A0A6M6BGI3_9BACT|nr:MULTISPECIES: DUF3891 family protein [Hymenobacter]QJX47336.1 DUF3891 family protein [Hymenobacter taeanensis]UOQ79326.1 DUF3891 family protein [Hymenobacter sp. 5414T-23]
MIVREMLTSFICLAQHDHAQISGRLAEQWQLAYFEGPDRRPEVLLASREHDRAWIPLDAVPIWNKQTQAPHSFLDYPTAPKVQHYQQGIEEVAHLAPYAGLLCSLHYTSFPDLARSPAGQQFLRTEAERQQHLKQQLRLTAPTEAATLEFHKRLLRFTDNLSLYLCLNEPGTTKEQEHPWYREGIPFSDYFAFTRQHTIQVEWPSRHSVRIHPSPFQVPFAVRLRYKELPKAQLTATSLGQCFAEAPVEELEVWVH